MDGARLEHDWFPRALPACLRCGERTWIYSAFAFLHARAARPDAIRIGNDTGVYHGTFFELGEDAEVEIGDFCTLVGATIRTDGRVRIGSYSFLAHEVVLADAADSAPPEAGARGRDTRGIVIGENCWIGMRATLLAGADLGEGCVVGAGAVVDFAAPPRSILAGNPARIVGVTR